LLCPSLRAVNCSTLKVPFAYKLFCTADRDFAYVDPTQLLCPLIIFLTAYLVVRPARPRCPIYIYIGTLSAFSPFSTTFVAVQHPLSLGVVDDINSRLGGASVELDEFKAGHIVPEP